MLDGQTGSIHVTASDFIATAVLTDRPVESRRGLRLGPASQLVARQCLELFADHAICQPGRISPSPEQSDGATDAGLNRLVDERPQPSPSDVACCVCLVVEGDVGKSRFHQVLSHASILELA